MNRVQLFLYPRTQMTILDNLSLIVLTTQIIPDPDEKLKYFSKQEDGEDS